ncbi:lipopolysaccharide transport periplasmic protein LptA [Pokkaliibacter sp. CJK22405]|uniref:lipopolysaccharide transport periplasmic protein LptA n=1 Tax=Pokkaliibacter sp. CJK22405 TaxID=3384615 RepID=UPI0039852450
MNLLAKVSLSLALLLPVVAQALPEDRNKPVRILSDNAALDDAKGTVTYTGKVKLTQGTLEIEADKVVLYLVNGELTRAKAFGKPAHYQQLPSPNEPLTHAYGQTLDYDLSKETITAQENAKLTQAKDTFTGDKIIYDITQRTVNASGGKSSNAGSGRVEMILHPKQKTTE